MIWEDESSFFRLKNIKKNTIEDRERKRTFMPLVLESWEKRTGWHGRYKNDWYVDQSVGCYHRFVSFGKQRGLWVRLLFFVRTEQREESNERNWLKTRMCVCMYECICSQWSVIACRQCENTSTVNTETQGQQPPNKRRRRKRRR